MECGSEGFVESGEITSVRGGELAIDREHESIDETAGVVSLRLEDIDQWSENLLLERAMRPRRVLRVVSRLDLEHASVVKSGDTAEDLRFVSSLVSSSGAVSNANGFNDKTKAAVVSEMQSFTR